MLASNRAYLLLSLGRQPWAPFTRNTKKSIKRL